MSWSISCHVDEGRSVQTRLDEAVQDYLDSSDDDRYTDDIRKSVVWLMKLLRDNTTAARTPFSVHLGGHRTEVGGVTITISVSPDISLDTNELVVLEPPDANEFLDKK